MLKIYSNILDENEFLFLENECNTFIADSLPSTEEKNYYFRKFIDENYVFSFHSKILNNFLNEKRINYNINGIWINKINSDSNKNDKYHTDASDLTILIFINDNFSGGEFAYIDDYGKINKIIPKKNSGIVMDKKLYHRVSPVSSGERFTLVCFIDILKKENKTLI